MRLGLASLDFYPKFHFHEIVPYFCHNFQDNQLPCLLSVRSGAWPIFMNIIFSFETPLCKLFDNPKVPVKRMM